MSDDTLSFTDKNWDPSPVYEIGNALIDFGDFLDEQAAALTDAEFNLNLGAWRGDAERYMTQAFADQRETVMNIIEEFWDTGEMINYYAMLRTEQEETLAKQALSELIAGLVGVFLGALLFVAPELLGLLGAVVGLLGRVSEMVAEAVTAISSMAANAARFVDTAVTAIVETLPDWAVTMAGITGNVARFGIELVGINAASVAAGNAAAGLTTTAQQIIPVPTSAEQIPGFIADMVLWGGVGIAVASAAKGLVNVAKDKLTVGKADVNVGDVTVGTSAPGTSVGNTATGTGSGSGLTLSSSVTSVSGTIADSSKGLTKSGLTLSSDVIEVNSAVPRSLAGSTVRTSTATAPAPTPVKVTTTGAADGPSAGGGTVVPDKVTPVDAGTSPGGSSAVRTVSDGVTQPAQPAQRTGTAGATTGGSTSANSSGVTSGVADGSTGQSVLHDVGSGLSGVARTAQAAQNTVDASTVGQSTGSQESVGASGAERVVRTNLDAQPATGTAHDAAPQTPSPASGTATGGRAQDTGGSAVPGVGKAADTGVQQAQDAQRTVGDGRAATPGTAARNAAAGETVSPVRSVPSAKPEVVHPASPVREASVGRIEGGGRTGVPETAGSAAPKSAAGEQGARGTVDAGASAKDIGTRANLADTAVRSGADQTQPAAGATDGTRTVPNAGREPLKSAAGLGGRQVRPVGRAEAGPAMSGEAGEAAALTGPAKDRSTPVEPTEGTSPAGGTPHAASARAVSESDGSGQTRTGAPGETSRAQRGADEARSAARSEQAGTGRTTPDRQSADTNITQAERQRVADLKEAVKRRETENSREAAVRREVNDRIGDAQRAEANARAEAARAEIAEGARAEATAKSADATSRSAEAKSADATDLASKAADTTRGKAGEAAGNSATSGKGLSGADEAAKNVAAKQTALHEAERRETQAEGAARVAQIRAEVTRDRVDRLLGEEPSPTSENASGTPWKSVFGKGTDGAGLEAAHLTAEAVSHRMESYAVRKLPLDQPSRWGEASEWGEWAAQEYRDYGSAGVQRVMDALESRLTTLREQTSGRSSAAKAGNRPEAVEPAEAVARAEQARLEADAAQTRAEHVKSEFAPQVEAAQSRHDADTAAVGRAETRLSEARSTDAKTQRTLRSVGTKLTKLEAAQKRGGGVDPAALEEARAKLTGAQTARSDALAELAAARADLEVLELRGQDSAAALGSVKGTVAEAMDAARTATAKADAARSLADRVTGRQAEAERAQARSDVGTAQTRLSYAGSAVLTAKQEVREARADLAESGQRADAEPAAVEAAQARVSAAERTLHDAVAKEAAARADLAAARLTAARADKEAVLQEVRDADGADLRESALQRVYDAEDALHQERLLAEAEQIMAAARGADGRQTPTAEHVEGASPGSARGETGERSGTEAPAGRAEAELTAAQQRQSDADGKAAAQRRASEARDALDAARRESDAAQAELTSVRHRENAEPEAVEAAQARATATGRAVYEAEAKDAAARAELEAIAHREADAADLKAAQTRAAQAEGALATAREKLVEARAEFRSVLRREVGPTADVSLREAALGQVHRAEDAVQAAERELRFAQGDMAARPLPRDTPAAREAGIARILADAADKRADQPRTQGHDAAQAQRLTDDRSAAADPVRLTEQAAQARRETETARQEAETAAVHRDQVVAEARPRLDELLDRTVEAAQARLTAAETAVREAPETTATARQKLQSALRTQNENRPADTVPTQGEARASDALAADRVARQGLDEAWADLSAARERAGVDPAAVDAAQPRVLQADQAARSTLREEQMARADLEAAEQRADVDPANARSAREWLSEAQDAAASARQQLQAARADLKAAQKADDPEVQAAQTRVAEAKAAAEDAERGLADVPRSDVETVTNRQRSVERRQAADAAVTEAQGRLAGARRAESDEAPARAARLESAKAELKAVQEGGDVHAAEIGNLRTRLAEAEQGARDAVGRAEVAQIRADHLAERADAATGRQPEPARAGGAKTSKEEPWQKLLTGSKGAIQDSHLPAERIGTLMAGYALRGLPARDGLGSQAKAWGEWAVREYQESGSGGVQRVMDALRAHISDVRQAEGEANFRKAAESRQEALFREAYKAGMTGDAARAWASELRQAWESGNERTLRETLADYEAAMAGFPQGQGKGLRAAGVEDPLTGAVTPMAGGRASRPAKDANGPGSGKSGTSEPGESADASSAGRQENATDPAAQSGRNPSVQAAVLDRPEVRLPQSPYAAAVADMLKTLDEKSSLPADNAEQAPAGETTRAGAEAESARTGETGRTDTGSQPGETGRVEDGGSGPATADAEAAHGTAGDRPAAAEPTSASADSSRTASSEAGPSASAVAKAEETRPGEAEAVTRYKADLQESARKADSDAQAAAEAVTHTARLRQEAAADRTAAQWRLETEVRMNRAADAAAKAAEPAGARRPAEQRGAVAKNTSATASGDRSASGEATRTHEAVTSSGTVRNEPAIPSAKPSGKFGNSGPVDRAGETRQTLDDVYQSVADWNRQRVEETASAARVSAQALREARAGAEDGAAPREAEHRAAADEAAAQAARAEAGRWDERWQNAAQEAAFGRPDSETPRNAAIPEDGTAAPSADASGAGGGTGAGMPEVGLNGGFTGARFVGRDELPTRDQASPLLPTSEAAVIVGGRYRAGDNRMYVAGQWRTAAQVAQYVERRTAWEPDARLPVVIVAGQAGREPAPGVPSFGAAVAHALQAVVITPVGQPVQTGPTRIVAGTPVPHDAGGVDLRVDTGQGFTLNVPGQRRAVPLGHDLGTALTLLGATLEPGAAPPSEPVIWSFAPEAPAGIARTTPTSAVAVQPDASGLSASDLSVLRADVNRELARLGSPHGPVDTARVADEYAALAPHWKRDLTSAADVVARAITDTRLGPVTGGAPAADADAGHTSSGVGAPVVLEGPRRVPNLTEVPVPAVPVPMGTGKGKGRERWFTYRRSSPHSSPPVEYEVSDMGGVRTPSLEVPSADGWVRFGGDFVHPASGALLLGDTGWLGLVHNLEELLGHPGFPAPGTAQHTLVADSSYMYLVPSGTSGTRGAAAVRIPLDPDRPAGAAAFGANPGANDGPSAAASNGTSAGTPSRPPVPEIVVTAPDDEQEPWYLSFDAMGQAVVPDSVERIEFTRKQARLWAGRVSQSLVLPGPGPQDALRAGIREEVGKLLLTEKPKHWDDVLAVGRTVVVDGRLVWLRPMMRALTPVPPRTGDVSEYPVGFAVTQTGGETSRETVQGADSILFTALNLGTSVAASIAALAAPQIVVGSSKERSNAWGQTILSGRKPFINRFNRFTAGLEMHVFVAGEEVTPADRLVTVPDRIQVDLPAPYSGAGQYRPDLHAPEPPRPAKPRKNGPSQARELLNAVNLTPVIAGLHRNLLAAGLPAPHVKKIMSGLGMDKSQGFLSEPTARNRYAWWAGGDVSNSVEVSGPLGRRFQGHLRIQAEVDSLQYLGDTNVGTRDDIGAGFSRTASSKGASVGGLGAGYNTAGIGGGGSDVSAAGTDPETELGHGTAERESVEVKGVAPAVGASVSGDRGAGYSLDTAHMSHTVLNVFGDQSRYRTGLRLTATMESSTHDVAPVVVTTESEQSVPQREAAQFVEGTVGPGWTADLRPADGAVNARRHRVHALPAPRKVRKLPTVRSPFRFGMDVSGPGLLPPHPREPLPLASRRGLGFGMPIALPGAETLQQDLRDAIGRHHTKAVGAKTASKSDWANADRDLAMFYGRSALEADPHQALLGIHRTIEVGGHRYKVSAKMRWGDRATGANPLTGPVNEDNPLGQSYTMKVNARVVSGATVAGERGKGTKARFAFGGGARLAIPEHEFNLGSLHIKTPPFRLAVGAFRGLLSRAWGKSDKFAGLAKEYRRTETAGKVDEHRYEMTLQWTVTPEGKKPSYLSGSNPAVARLVVPHEHVPTEPVSLKRAQEAGRTEVTDRRPPTERPLDFSSGTHGLYPVFHLMPELAQLAARMYAKQHQLPDSWLRNPADWPEEIRDLAHPGILTSRFGAMSGALGHQSELPKEGKHKQAFRVRLHTHAPSDLGRSPDVEVEHYAQAAATHAAEREAEWSLGLAGSLGPQFRFGSDAEDEGHHSGLGGRVTVLGYGEAAKKWGGGSGSTAGRIDITRATYSGDVHTVRTTPVFEVTYVRWRGKELTETTEFLTADQALDLLTPERRLSDIMPAGAPAADAAQAAPAGTGPAPVTVPEIVVTPPEGEEPAVDPAPAPAEAADSTGAAAPAALPEIVVTPPEGEQPATDPGTAAAATAAVPDPGRLSPTARQQSVAPPPRTRTYLHQDLIAGIGHPEVMRADGVLDAITGRLRGHGVMTTERGPDVAPRPNLLTRSLSSSFSSDALRSEWHALTTNQGVSRWFPVPGPFGSTRYLWVKVTATRLGPAAGQRPRDDIKLTLRGESVHETSEAAASGSELSGGLDLRGRIGAGSLHGGLEGGVEYSTSRGEADEEAVKRVKIYRANPKDASEEFNHDLTFRVEMGTTTELPEALSLPARGVGRITRLFSGEPSRDKGVFTWYDAGDGTTGNSPLVEGGSVRLLVPRHLTAAVQEWPRAIDLTGTHETEVTWTPAPKPGTPEKRDPAQGAAQGSQLPDALLENLHPWSVPAASSIGRWAAVTAVRHRTPPALDVSAPPHVSGLNFTTRAGLRYNHYTSGNMLRPHIKELLKQTYEVPVGDKKAVVGLELDRAEILGPPEGTLVKQRTYTQTDEEPKHEVEKESGWQFALGPEMGGSLGDHKMFDRLPITIKNWMDGRKRTTAVGDTDERNKEGQRHYRLYRFDVTAIIKGPHGTVRVKVPDGLFGMLPIDKATGRLADGLEEELNGLLAPPRPPLPAMPTRPAPAPPVPPVPPRTSSLSAKSSRPAPVPPMPTRPAPAPPVPARTSSLSAKSSRPAPVPPMPTRPAPAPPVPSPTPAPVAEEPVPPTEENLLPAPLPKVDGRTVVQVPGQEGLLLRAPRGEAPKLLGSGADAGLFTVANVNNRVVVQESEAAGGPAVHSWTFARLGGLRLAEERVLLRDGSFHGSMITIAGVNVADVPAGGADWPAKLGDGGEIIIASTTGNQIYRRTTGEFITVSTPDLTPPVRPAHLSGEQGERWDAAVNLARAHLGAAATDHQLKLYMLGVTIGAFTSKKGYGGFVTPRALAGDSDLVAKARTFNKITRDLLHAGPNRRVTLWRGVSMDPDAAQADRFIERLPASTSHSREFQAAWARHGINSNRVIFEIDVPADHGKFAMAYPPGYAGTADDAPALNQDQWEVTLSPTRLIRTGPSRVEDGITVIPVRAEQIPVGELESVITEQWAGLPSATAFGDFGRAFEQSSLRRWHGLQDATVREVGTDPLVRSFVVSRPGLAGELTITVTHRPADDAVSVAFSGDGVPPFSQEWSGAGFSEIAADLRGNVLYNNDLFVTLPTPASWRDLAGGPAQPERLLSMPSVSSAGPATGAGESAGPEPSDAADAAASATGPGGLDPAAVDETAPSGPWTTGAVTFQEGSKEIGPDQRGYIAALARKVSEVGLRDVRAGLPAPWITVTGYGNGSWLTPGRDDWGAERTGQERADAVAGVFRTEIWNALYLLQQNDPPTARRVDDSAFRILSLSEGRKIAAGGPSDDAGLRALRRRADIEIELAPRSPAVELLNKLRLASPDAALREAPFDPDPFARRILHLAPKQPVRDTHRQELYALVDKAIAAGRATSLTALGAYDLWRRGALSDATRITAPDGRTLGRNWTDNPVLDMITTSYHQLSGGSVVATPTALWEPQGSGDNRPYVVAAKGDHDHVVVRLADGSRPRVPLEEFAELLAADPDLAALDGRLPVVLAVPRAGARNPRLPRVAAARTGRTVWSHSGQVKLYEDPLAQRTRIAVIDQRFPREPLGSWFASEPDSPRLTDPASGAGARFVRTIDGTLVPDDEIMSYTLAADGRPYGRAVFDKRDQSDREKFFESLPAMNEYVHIDPVRLNHHGDAENVPWAGRPAYYFGLHGSPGAFAVVTMDGTHGQARGDQVGGYLQRRPSLQRLAADGVVVLMSCWVGAAADDLPRVREAGRAPFVADPLATVSEAQQVANEVERTVFAVDRVYYLTRDAGVRRHGIATTAEGERRKWLELRPEPTGAALDDLARTAGLHTGAGPAPDETRVATLRLVRALRQVFGAAAEDDKDDAYGEYQRLLRGIGALETMRLNDPILRDTGPFTMDLLERAARSHLGRSAGSALDSTDILAVLEAAETRPAGVALREFVPLASVDEALSWLAKGDPDQRAVQVLELGSDPVTAVHRQRLLWATVKAVEGLKATTDADSLAVTVLHLEASARPVDDARRAELLWTMAGAAAAGRDPGNPTALGAYHLERHDALSQGTLLKSPSGEVLGRNWTGAPLTDPLVPDRYLASSNGTDGTNARTRHTPWRVDGALPGERPAAYFVLAEGGPDHIDMPWPDGSRRPVPVDEIAELLANDPVLSGRPVREAIVPIVPHTGRGRAMAKALSSRSATARTVYTPAVDLALFHDTAAHEHVIVVAPQPQGSGSRAEWVRTDPPRLVAPASAAPAAPAPVVVTTAGGHSTEDDGTRLPAAGRAAESVSAVEEIVQGPMPNAAIPTDAADIIPPPIPYRGRQVFVADTGRPETVLTEGLVPGGTGLDLVAYAQLGGGAGHGFVSAGTSPESAAERLSEGYVWEVDAPGGIDITATLGAYGIFEETTGGDEVLFAGGVASRFVKGGWAIVPGGEANTLGEWIPNPDYRPYDDSPAVTAPAPASTPAPARRLPIEPVLDKRVFQVEDVVSAEELQSLAGMLAGADPDTGERYAAELGARLTGHIRAELSRQGVAVGHLDLHLSMRDQGHALPAMALASVVANGLGRRAMLTVGALRQPFDICPSN
ncbi:lonely Cys domain-containing protein [Streptomyces sp. NPDC002574]|uniref:lonely Cys domain-containing protein n=1 Tax=Streptomyces sp. NPDC002574 TaxID=3364652 RepID=UPI00369527FD